MKKLEEENIIVDLSHASPKTFEDVIKIAQKPLMVTHTCCKKICNHPRNLTDEQIIQIGKNQGIIGVCLYSTFLREQGIATVKDVVQHIKHIVDLIGIDHVAIGTDFDGFDKKLSPRNIKKVNDIYKIFEELRKENFSEEEIQKIASGNVLNMLAFL